MTQPPYDPLFEPGIIPASMEDIEDKCVLFFNNSKTRTYLFLRLKIYLEELSKVGTRFLVWIDGSFVTSKLNPSDIDIVIWYTTPELNDLSNESQQLFSELVADKNMIRLRYGIDVFCAAIEDFSKDRYWRKTFGCVKGTKTPKGVLQITIEANDEPDSMA